MGAMDCWGDVMMRWPCEGASGPAAEIWETAEKRLLPLALRNLKAKPFPEVRSHTWRLLSVFAAKCHNAAQAALPSEEMRLFMLDFASETSTEARIAKHEFVVALVKHQSRLVHGCLEEKVGEVLEEFARQGPHWQPHPQASVDVGKGSV